MPSCCTIPSLQWWKEYIDKWKWKFLSAHSKVREGKQKSYAVVKSGTSSNKGIAPGSSRWCARSSQQESDLTCWKERYPPKWCSIAGNYHISISESVSKNDLQNLVKTWGNFNSISEEQSKSDLCDRNAVVFNFPDCKPAETIKHRIPDACNLSHYQGSCMRQRKRFKCALAF